MTTLYDETDILILGAGGHAKVASDCARGKYAHPLMLDRRPDKTAWDHIPIISEDDRTFSEWRELCPRAFVAIGDNDRRQAVTEKLEAAGFELVSLIHPSAVVSPSALLGPGTLVCPGAVVNADVRIGKGCIVNTAAVVEHECVVEDYVHVSPGAMLCGNVWVGKKSWICSGAIIANNLRIGGGTTVGAGAAVVSHLPDNVLAAGVPAVIKRK